MKIRATEPGPEPVAAPPPDPLPHAFETLFRAEYPRVVAIATRVLGDPREAEDVAQEVFLSYHRRHAGSVTFAGSWLHSAAVHTSLNSIRGRRRRERREYQGAIEQVGAGRQPDPAEVLEVEENRRLVREALSRLPPRTAAVLALRYSGLSYAEVAAALGVRIGQVGTRLRRAEGALRKEVEDASSR